jgi:outer membrane protein insertion porin family
MAWVRETEVCFEIKSNSLVINSNTCFINLLDDSIGGDLYYSTGLSLVSHIPSKPEWPVKTHLWVNAGRLESINQGQNHRTTSQFETFSLLTFADEPLEENIRNALRRPAFSVGMGLIYQFNPVRVEVNFGVPLAASSSDAMRRGLQVGMGLEFL